MKDIENKARKEELDRIREISSIAERHQLADLGRKFIDEGLPVEEFRKVVLDELEKRGSVKKVTERAEIGMSDKEIKEFSFMRAINAIASNNRSLAGYEMEISDEVAKRLKRSPRGFFVPMDVLAKRDLTKGTAADGGNLVGENFLASSFIEMLRNRIVLRQLGAKVLDGLVGDVAIPSQSGATTAYWVTEGNPPTESKPAFGKVELKPKSIAAWVDISRKLLLQSTPAVEGLVRSDLAAVLAIGIDLAGINGSSSSDEPVGILNTVGIGSVVGGTDGAAPTWNHIVDLETEVSVDNADVGNLYYLTNAKVRGKLKKTFTNGTYGEIPVWGKGTQKGFGELNGYDAAVSNQVPGTLTKNSSVGVCSAIIFGNFADLLIGFWGALDINVDTASLSTVGGLRVVAFQDCDVAVRHAQSFAAMVDALTS